MWLLQILVEGKNSKRQGHRAQNHNEGSRSLVYGTVTIVSFANTSCYLALPVSGVDWHSKSCTTGSWKIGKPEPVAGKIQKSGVRSTTSGNHLDSWSVKSNFHACSCRLESVHFGAISFQAIRNRIGPFVLLRKKWRVPFSTPSFSGIFVFIFLEGRAIFVWFSEKRSNSFLIFRMGGEEVPARIWARWYPHTAIPVIIITVTKPAFYSFRWTNIECHNRQKKKNGGHTHFQWIILSLLV